jgi:hypothetical protein
MALSMNANKQIKQVTASANELLVMINNEDWDEAMQLSQQLDIKIRNLIRGQSAEQLIAMKSEIEKIVHLNRSIEKHLIKLRAKVLTQIQENNSNRTAIQLYHNSV